MIPMESDNIKTDEETNEQNKSIIIDEAIASEMDNSNKTMIELDDFPLETYIYKDPENEVVFHECLIIFSFTIKLKLFYFLENRICGGNKN